MSKLSFRRLRSCIAVSAAITAASFCAIAPAQEQEPGQPGSQPAGSLYSEEELQNLLNSIPDDGTMNAGEGPAVEASSEGGEVAALNPEGVENPVSRVAELEQLIESFEDRNLSRDERRQVKQLRDQLGVARLIARQLERTSLTRESPDDRKAPEDSFVIAQIAVAAGSDVADITFTTLSGEVPAADILFDFVKETPEGGYHDFRIVSRHVSFGGAEDALQNVRAEYDAQREREAQILAYIAERNRQLSALRSARRC